MSFGFTAADLYRVHKPFSNIILNDQTQFAYVKTQLTALFPNLLIQTYREISPDLELYENQIKSLSIIYLTVIMLALIFGIINTMLMAVVVFLAVGLYYVLVYLIGWQI